MKCDHDHPVAKAVLGPPSRKISPLGRSLVRIYRKNVLSMYRAVRAWLHLMVDAEEYGALHQWVLGEEPILESLTEYEAWEPTTRLAKALFDVRVEQTADRFRKAGQVTSFSNITSTLVDWDCVRMAGDRRMGTQHLRIFGEAMGKTAQIARIETSFDVVNMRAVKWASENTNRVINELVKDQIAGVGEYISRGIAEGDSMATIGRQMRRNKLFGLNQRQMRAMRGFREKVTSRYSRLKGGLTGRHGPSRLRKIERAVQREATKKLRYRAEMIARTETSRAVSEGTLEAYDVGRTRHVEFEASADACLICIGYDGNIFTLSAASGLIPVHPNCLISAAVKVYTADGWRPVGKVAVGDLVLTHRGRFRPVVELHRNRAAAGVVQLRAGPHALSVTEDHPVLINGQWIPAREAKVGDHFQMMSTPCETCGKPMPWTPGTSRRYCNQFCQWKNPEHRKLISAKTSAQLVRQYADGTRDRATAWRAGNQALRDKPYTPRPHMSGMFNNAKRPEVREKIRLSKLGDKNAMKRPEVAAKVSAALRAFYAAHPEKHPNARLAQKARRSGPASTTYIERMMWKELKARGISFSYNHRVGSLWVDFALVEHNIAVECDGAYWHQDEEKERTRDARLEAAGWTMLHFTGSEIERDVSACADKIERVLANHEGQYEFHSFEITEIKRKPPEVRSLWNLSVEEDESYVAAGFVVHNCRCNWLPVVDVTGAPAG